MSTKEIFNQYNKKLKQKFIPKKGELIECNFVIDVNDKAFHKPIPKINVVQCN